MAKNRKDKENIEDNSTAPTEETVVEETNEAEVAEQEPSPDDLLKAEHDRYMRLAAEYDNFRKRSQKERESLFSAVRGDTILELLPVYDNLERALKLETQDEAFYKGIEMTMTQFVGIMEKMGVKMIDAMGQKFDANLHYAVMHVDDDSFGENEIVEEFQKGFTLGDKVIRFSMVKVAN